MERIYPLPHRPPERQLAHLEGSPRTNLAALGVQKLHETLTTGFMGSCSCAKRSDPSMQVKPETVNDLVPHSSIDVALVPIR